LTNVWVFNNIKQEREVDSMSSKKAILLITSIALVFSIGHGLAQEKPEGYPKRTIEVVVPFGAGGGSDVFARTICIPARRTMGANVVILNKPGAPSISTSTKKADKIFF